MRLFRRAIARGKKEERRKEERKKERKKEFILASISNHIHEVVSESDSKGKESRRKEERKKERKNSYFHK
jgi:hypothetical protein